jgi:transcriptional regulator with GAF, ATPase, and Fis domain
VETAGRRLGDALTALAHELVARVDADACILSRAVGDVLIVVARTVSDDALLPLGQGYLVSDFPATAHVLATGEPTALTVADPDVDEREAQLLRELGFATLLMFPFAVAGAQWGLAELYRTDVRPFAAADIDAARSLARVG